MADKIVLTADKVGKGLSVNPITKLLDTNISTDPDNILVYGTDNGLKALNQSSSNSYTKDEINSRMDNLVINGYGHLKNNTNFTQFTYDGTDAPIGVNGCFKTITATSPTNLGLTTTELIPVNPNNSYKIRNFIRHTGSASTSTAYFAAQCLDIDKNIIYQYHHQYVSGSTTTLAQDLKPGDTLVYLTSVTNWYNLNGSNNQRSLIFWNYTNSAGYTYPIGTYSRNVYLDVYAGGAINTTNKTITLIQPWSGPKIAAGTSVSNVRASSSDPKVIVWGSSYIPISWTPYSATIGTINTTGGEVDGQFRPGTSYIQLYYSVGLVSGSQFRLAGVSVDSLTPSTVSSTTGVNANIPAIGITSDNTLPNADLVLAPRGTGSIIAQIPDGGTAGGNKRGNYSIDLQFVRSSGAQVVGGTYSFATGANNTLNSSYSTVSGYNNTASQTSSSYIYMFGNNNTGTSSSGLAVFGGYNTCSGWNTFTTGTQNTNSGNYSFCGGQGSKALNNSWMFSYGNNCQASGDNAIAMGNYCSASGSSSFALGNQNTANASYSIALGNYTSTRGIIGNFAFGHGSGQQGNAQSCKYPLYITTTNDTVTNITTNNLSTLSTTNTVCLPTSSAYTFDATIIARSSTGDAASWDISGMIIKGTTIASTAFVGTPTITSRGATSNASSWVVNVYCENTNLGAVIFTVKGALSSTIRWTGTVLTNEIIN